MVFFFMFAKRNETIGIFNTIPQGWTEISEAGGNTCFYL